MALSFVCLSMLVASAQRTTVSAFTPHEVLFTATGTYNHPYVELAAHAEVTAADGRRLVIPLFWAGERTWILRFSPDRPGTWSWVVRSPDAGLDKKSGRVTAVAGAARGSIVPMASYPRHFARQDGSRVWFMGDTAWALFTNNAEERHDRAAALRYSMPAPRKVSTCSIRWC